MTAQTVAFVLKGYPRLSETFIAQEIRALERHGLDIRLVSLRHPTDPAVHPVHREIEAPVLYLPEYLRDEPGRCIRAWRQARHLPGYRRARALWRRDLARDPTPNRVRRFGQAMVLAAELPDEVGRLHAHFLHTPASVTRYASVMRGLRWSCSAHAKDIWTTPDWEIREKLSSADWLVTCTEAGHQELTRHAEPGSDIELVYHGLDLDRFPRFEREASRDGSNIADPVVILSVGRLVRKKGFDVLLDALRELPASLSWRMIHIGGGQNGKLKAQAEALGIDDRIDWRGPQAQHQVLAAYREADLFVLASRIGEDGDRDGLPNVLMEAHSQSLPVIATDVSGIPELVQPGVTGHLVPPEDPRALADAMARALTDPALRQRMGAAGRQHLESRFSHEIGIERLARRFGLTENDRGGSHQPAAAVSS